MTADSVTRPVTIADFTVGPHAPLTLIGGPCVIESPDFTLRMADFDSSITGELLQPIKAGCSLVIVEHDLDFIRDICDRLTVLDQGSVLCCGTVQEIQSNPKVQEVYLRRA